MIKQVLLAAAAVSVLALASGAGAATVYNDVSDFSTTSATGIWSYGTGVTGSSFTPDTNYSNPCDQLVGVTNLGCWQTSTPVSAVPLVMKNFNATTVDFSTVVEPTDVLNVHPGPDTDSIVSFKAPTAGDYNVSGFFELLDTNPSGVNVIYGTSPSSLVSTTLTTPAASGTTPGQKVTFDENVFLTGGENFYFGVNRDGTSDTAFFNDSTGLSATITAAPEPSTWALLILGVGAIGGALQLARRRDGSAALAA